MSDPQNILQEGDFFIPIKVRAGFPESSWLHSKLFHLKFLSWTPDFPTVSSSEHWLSHSRSLVNIWQHTREKKTPSFPLFLCLIRCPLIILLVWYQAFSVAAMCVLPALLACLKRNQGEFLNKYFPSCMGTQNTSPSHQIQRMNKRQQRGLECCFILINTVYI